MNFFASQAIQAVVRQAMIVLLLPEKKQAMIPAKQADIRFFWIWSFILTTSVIASAFGRTIVWRGIRYQLLGPTEVAILQKRTK